MYTINKTALTIQKKNCPVHQYRTEHAFNTALTLLLVLKFDQSLITEEHKQLIEASLTA